MASSPYTEDWDDQDWWSALAALIEEAAGPGEVPEDILHGCWTLGQRRAFILQRKFWPGDDVVHPLCLFCWWLFKPELPDTTRDYIRRVRGALFSGVAEDEAAMRRLNEVISDELLSRRTADVLDQLGSEPAWRVLQIDNNDLRR